MPARHISCLVAVRTFFRLFSKRMILFLTHIAMNSCFLSISSSSPVSLDNVTELSFSLETVKQGKGLLAADINGKSDPYAVIKIGDKQIHKTEIEKATLNPVWAEKFKTYGFVFFFFSHYRVEFYCAAPSIPWMRTCNSSNLRSILVSLHRFYRVITNPTECLTVDVWDWDRFSKDDFLGTVTILLTEVRITERDYTNKGWRYYCSSLLCGLFILRISYDYDNAHGHSRWYSLGPRPGKHEKAQGSIELRLKFADIVRSSVPSALFFLKSYPSI